MKDDNPENRPALRYFRYAVLALTALIVLSLGFAFIPQAPPPAPEPPFSEQARAAALQETLRLRASAARLSAAPAAATVNPGANPAVTDPTVTLLTLQARALLSPSDSSPTAEPGASGTAPAPDATSALEATPGPEPVPTPRDLAIALSASGLQRLADAEKADGGMARLLAGAGTAQLLAAEGLADPAGVTRDALPHARQATPAAAPGSAAPPLGGPAPGSTTATPCPTPSPTAAGLGSALSMAVQAEQQNVYAYEAALPRLTPADAATAAAFLGQHQDLAAEASAHSRAACAVPGVQQPGYVLDAEFFAAPAAGLARLELAALPAYGDIVALADGGELRKWAISAMGATSRRAVQWGGDPGPLPGVLLDLDQLPELPGAVQG